MKQQPQDVQDIDGYLGPCCGCGGHGATNVVMLPRRAPMPGRGWGWGCVQCRLPMDGAVAVLCETCLGRYQRNNASLWRCCRGYPKTDGRVQIADLPDGVFDHDPARHPENADDAAQ